MPEREILLIDDLVVRVVRVVVVWLGYRRERLVLRVCRSVAELQVLQVQDAGAGAAAATSAARK